MESEGSNTQTIHDNQSIFDRLLGLMSCYDWTGTGSSHTGESERETEWVPLRKELAIALGVKDKSEYD